MKPASNTYPLLYTIALLLAPAAVAGNLPPPGMDADAWRQVEAAIVEQVDAEIAAGEDEALRGGITAVHGLIRRQVLVGDYSDLPAQDAPNGPEFGYSVAMEGEWLVVGAPGTIWTHDNHGTAAHGAVFVFRRGEDGNWSLFQRLLRANGTSGAQPGSRCGHAVVLRFPHMTFGCPEMATAGVERRGQIYHYRFAGVTFQPSRTVSGPSSGRRCGAALALTPNYLAIGCPTDGSGAGQVRIVRQAGNDTFPLDAPEAVITPGVDVFGFGWSVALREPGAFVFGEPGNVRLAIGAPNTIFAGTIFPRGSAFVYQRALGSATWTLNSTMRPAPVGSDVATGARFGEAVAMNRNQLLVGAPSDRWASVQTLPGPGTARRYVLTDTLGSWSWVIQEVRGIGSSNALFGESAG